MAQRIENVCVCVGGWGGGGGGGGGGSLVILCTGFCKLVDCQFANAK